MKLHGKLIGTYGMNVVVEDTSQTMKLLEEAKELAIKQAKEDHPECKGEMKADIVGQDAYGDKDRKLNYALRIEVYEIY